MIDVRPYGEAALLVDCPRTQVAAAAQLLSRKLPGVEVIPAAETLLLQLSEPTPLGSLIKQVRELLDPIPTQHPPAAHQTLRIQVSYDGNDLDSVAELTGLSRSEIIAAHTGQPWQVAFGGFAPGFAYLDGGDPRLRVPRHEVPRTAVPAGSVALAGDYCGIYPRTSPGGWQLIGRTTASMWDLARQPPALLRPGWWVQFEEVR